MCIGEVRWGVPTIVPQPVLWPQPLPLTRADRDVVCLLSRGALHAFVRGQAAWSRYQFGGSGKDLCGVVVVDGRILAWCCCMPVTGSPPPVADVTTSSSARHIVIALRAALASSNAVELAWLSCEADGTLVAHPTATWLAQYGLTPNPSLSATLLTQCIYACCLPQAFPRGPSHGTRVRASISDNPHRRHHAPRMDCVLFMQCLRQVAATATAVHFAQ